MNTAGTSLAISNIILFLKYSRVGFDVDFNFNWTPLGSYQFKGWTFLVNPFRDVSLPVLFRDFFMNANHEWLTEEVPGSEDWTYYAYYPDPSDSSGTRTLEVGTYWNPDLKTYKWQILADAMYLGSIFTIIKMVSAIGFVNIGNFLAEKALANGKHLSKAQKINKLHDQMDLNDPNSVASRVSDTKTQLTDLTDDQTIASVNKSISDSIKSGGNLNNLITSIKTLTEKLEVVVAPGAAGTNIALTSQLSTLKQDILDEVANVTSNIKDLAKKTGLKLRLIR